MEGIPHVVAEHAGGLQAQIRRYQAGTTVAKKEVSAGYGDARGSKENFAFMLHIYMCHFNIIWLGCRVDRIYIYLELSLFPVVSSDCTRLAAVGYQRLGTICGRFRFWVYGYQSTEEKSTTSLVLKCVIIGSQPLTERS